MLFEPKGPPRYQHQKKGLRKLIDTKGVCALLWDPGLGKTSTVLDFASILALKRGAETETRVLVVAPLVAVDTWIKQVRMFVTDQVSVWAEAVGGSVKQRTETLASRGGWPVKKGAGRAVGVRRSYELYARDGERELTDYRRGPDALSADRPRLVIMVVSFGTFSSRQRQRSRTMADVVLNAIVRFDPELMVVDEMHKIKGVSSNQSRLISRVGDRVPRRIGLTGTVMPTSALDVYGQWRFIDPYAFGELDEDGKRQRATQDGFRDRYAQMGGYMGKQVIGFKNLDDLRRVLVRSAIVAKKADALDLPEVTDIDVSVRLSSREREAYESLREGLRVDLQHGAGISAGNVLTKTLRLRQVASGYLPDDDKGLHDLGFSKSKVIDEIVNTTLEGESRVVVFCVFTAEIQHLTKLLQRKGTEVMVATGATPRADRQTMRERFGSDDPARMIFLAQIQTMSLAVNELVTASNAVFGSLSQRRDELVQAQDRLHRIGQTKPVMFWYALVPNSVDEVIMESRRKRTSLEAAMLRHIQQGENQ